MAHVEATEAMDESERSFDSNDDDDDDGDVSSSSSDNSKDEEELRKRIAELESTVELNPYEYNPHVELVTLLRRDADLEKLRVARERMSRIFPLTEDLWLDWLQDEEKLTTTDAEREEVTKLCERAVQDYLSVDVWLEFVQFSIGEMGMKDGVVNVRSVFERALTAVGLHVVKGNVIWEAYREFESALLAPLQMAVDGGEATEEQQKEYKAQKNRVLNLFKRQLSVPLLGMDETYEELKEWQEGKIDSNIETGYKNALQKLEKIKPYEEALLAVEPPRLAEYEEYIDFELKAKEPSRIQCIFERCLAENCLIPEMWQKYINYLETTLKIDTISLPVMERSVRNCPWSVSLWQSYIRGLEKYNQPHEKVKELVDRALQAGFSAAEEFLQLWTTFIDYLRRRIKWNKEHEKELEEFRSTSLKAHNNLVEYFGTNADVTGSILRFWARLEGCECQNMEKSRELWNEVMLMGQNNRTAQMWLEYAALERTYGDYKHLRSLYQKALQVVNDWPEGIAEAWVNFERDKGSLEEWENAVAKIETKMSAIEDKRKKETEGEVRDKSRLTSERSDKKSSKSGKAQQKSSSSLKRKLDETTDEKAEADVFKVPPLPTKNVGKWETLSSSESQAKKAKYETSHGETHVHDSSKDHLTVFLSNLAYDAEEGAIKNMFKSVGEIVNLRLVRDYRGRGKGYGYLQFKTSAQVDEALKKDRETLNGRPIFVSQCEDKKKKSEKDSNKSRFKYNTNMEKNKIFIRGLPFTTTKEELRELFQPFGEILDVRIVTYRNGHSKGLAYIDYKTEQSATSAVLKLDGSKFGDRIISVVISAPPERQDPPKVLQQQQPVLGGGSEVGSRGRSRTQVSLLPRAIQRSQATEAGKDERINGTQNGNTEQTKPKSNEEFRNLLFNK